jgi:hypothetical protein
MAELKTNLTQSQLDQLANLISFDEDSEGVLRIRYVKGHVYGDVYGDVKGDVLGSVKGSVKGSVWGNVWGGVEGNVWGSVECDVWAYRINNITKLKD